MRPWSYETEQGLMVRALTCASHWESSTVNPSGGSRAPSDCMRAGVPGPWGGTVTGNALLNCSLSKHRLKDAVGGRLPRSWKISKDGPGAFRQGWRWDGDVGGEGERHDRITLLEGPLGCSVEGGLKGAGRTQGAQLGGCGGSLGGLG